MITRQQFLQSLGGLLAGLASGAPSRPNFLFILCDDMGWGDLPCFGHRGRVAHGGWIEKGDLKMPHLDRLAREGSRFTQYYVASAVCSPSRAAVMTGHFPARHRIHDYLATAELNAKRGCADSLDPSVPTLTRLLQQSGYATAHFGKWHLSSGPDAPKPEAYGIDRFDPCMRGPASRVHSTTAIADATIAFLESNRGKPFYINAWLYDPHSPLRPTEEMMEPYKNLSPAWGNQKGSLEVFYSVLTYLDQQVGRILDALDRLALSKSTVVIFSSDNGPESPLIPFTSHYGGAASAGPFRGHKRSLYEGGIRTPFIARWPGKVPAGKVDDNTVLAGVDLLPTCCSIAGVPAPKDLDGEDLSAALLGKSTSRRKLLFWENRFPVYGSPLHQSPLLALREGRWKLLMNPDKSRLELYDIPNDPSEIDNLAANQPAVVRRLSERLLAWQATLPKGPIDPDAGRRTYPWPGKEIP